MPPKFYKHRLLLDEGLFPRKRLKRLNSRYDIKHIKHELRGGGLEDEEVYKIAIGQKRIIITYNTKHFRMLAKKSTNSGIIGVTQRLTPEQLDKKLNSLLSRNSEKSLYGKYTSLSKGSK